MIIEIHYKGEVIGEIELPQIKDVKELQLSARIASSMGKQAGEASYRVHIPTIYRTPKPDFRQVPHNSPQYVPKNIRCTTNFLKSRAHKEENATL